MFRPIIFLCILGSSMTLHCWKGVLESGNVFPGMTQDKAVADTDCAESTTCSRSAYKNMTEYGCGEEACERLPVAVDGCEEKTCTKDLCNGPTKCMFGASYDGYNVAFLVEKICEVGETKCFTKRQEVTNGTLSTYGCGICAKDDGVDQCDYCTGRLCNGALTVIPSLAIMAIVLSWMV
eukprot:sb/3471772/